MGADISPSETTSLPAHVAACGVRYKNLHDYLRELANKISRLEKAMVGGMVIIIALLTKLAFWPGG